jgi:hypothetical protein
MAIDPSVHAQLIKPTVLKKLAELLLFFAMATEKLPTYT